MTFNLPFACVIVGCILCIIGGALASLQSFRKTRNLQQTEQENRSLVEYTQKIEKRNQDLAKKNEELNLNNQALNQKIYDLSTRIIELKPSGEVFKDVERYLNEKPEDVTSSNDADTGKSATGKK